MTEVIRWVDRVLPPRARRYLGASRRLRVAAVVLGIWAVAALLSFGVRDASGIAAGLVGARAALLTVGTVLGIAVPLGWGLGLLAGAGPRVADVLLARLVELGSVWPTVVLLAVVRAAEPVPSWTSFVIVVALTRALRIARLVRGEALRVRHATHVVAARAVGASRRELLVIHVAPLTLSPLLVAAAFTGAATIALDTALSQIGLGVPEDWGSWGSQLGSGLGARQLVAASGVAVTTGALVLLADCLDDALDPRRAVRIARSQPEPAQKPAIGP